MPNPENIKGQGFHTNPERINRNGNPGSKWLKTRLRELLESDDYRDKVLTALPGPLTFVELSTLKNSM